MICAVRRRSCISSASGACSKRNTPSSPSRNSLRMAFWYSSDKFMPVCWRQRYGSYRSFHKKRLYGAACLWDGVCDITGGDLRHFWPAGLLTQQIDNIFNGTQRHTMRQPKLSDTAVFAYPHIHRAPAFAQETFVQPPARLLTTFPFRLFTGGVMILRARLDSFPDSLNFILDTGSGGISLELDHLSAACT